MGFSAEVNPSLGASPLDVALGVSFFEGDGPKATDRFGEPSVYADAVGDLKQLEDPAVAAKWGPSLSHFQIRTLRDPFSGNLADRWRMANRLVDASAPGGAAMYATQAALAISKQGTDWHLWSVFTSGKYKERLGQDFNLRTGHPLAHLWNS